MQEKKYFGGYCGGVPPLPIPNREVKPACADGTAMRCGRVGGRLLSIKFPSLRGEPRGDGFFCRHSLEADGPNGPNRPNRPNKPNRTGLNRQNKPDRPNEPNRAELISPISLIAK